jgi:adenine phosphoribosyltransferase
VGREPWTPAGGCCTFHAARRPYHPTEDIPHVEHLRSLIRDVPDFPSPGIVFRDIMPLLRSPAGLADITAALADRYRGEGVDLVAGIESRGFLFGAPLAHALGTGFVAVRKLGKLPGPTIQREYALEYGSNHLELQADAVRSGERVLVVDDVLATGGTARASLELVRQLGGEPAGVAFLVELTALRGRDLLAGHDVFSLLTY